ncbi:LLM class flavin-dependent oxidoreductase [Gammaproteobacteria bacterium]|nr:LLM class flavin-dependent oxidoreductase [Gammaproteobacteria bacterium]
MRVSFGVGLRGEILPRQENIRKYMDMVKMAEDFGVAAIGTYDSSFDGGDMCVRTTLTALASHRARIGPRPTNPLSREPQVMASFLASIDSLTNGRAFMDIATGDSAVYNIGYKAATRDRIEDYITCIRDLLIKGEATYQGRPQRVRWVSEAVRDRIPVSVCAEGPKILHLAGRVGDAVIAGTGLTPEVIQDTIVRVHAGARDAGRKPDEVDIWFSARSSLHENSTTAIENVKASVSSILNHSMRFGIQGKNLPEELHGRVKRYVDGYVLYDHFLDAGQNPKRMEEHGLTDYAIERWALAGNPSDWVKRIEEIAEAGATKLWISNARGDIDRQIRYLRLFGEQVMPHFN